MMQFPVHSCVHGDAGDACWKLVWTKPVTAGRQYDRMKWAFERSVSFDAIAAIVESKRSLVLAIFIPIITTIDSWVSVDEFGCDKR